MRFSSGDPWIVGSLVSNGRVCSFGVKAKPTVTKLAGVDRLKLPLIGIVKGGITLPSARPVTVAPASCCAPEKLLAGEPEYWIPASTHQAFWAAWPSKNRSAKRSMYLTVLPLMTRSTTV